LREAKSWAGAISAEKTTTVMRALKKMNLFILLSLTKASLDHSTIHRDDLAGNVRSLVRA
jgi:hypothetical protein